MAFGTGALWRRFGCRTCCRIDNGVGFPDFHPHFPFDLERNPCRRTREPAADPLWVVCLCAEWCGACREYRPLFEQVARAHPRLRFAWVDIEDHADLADAFDVETFPTLLVAGAGGTHFLGPLLPHAATLSRLLGALQPAQPATPEVANLLKALASEPRHFRGRLMRPGAIRMNVLLFGASGMVGQGVLRECLLDPDVASVLCVGRSPTGRAHPKLRELIVRGSA